MELDQTAIRDGEVAASEETEGPVPRALTLHDRVEVAEGAVPPEARPPVRTAVVAVADLMLVRAVEAAAAALAVVAAVCHRVAAAEGAADINRPSPQAL